MHVTVKSFAHLRDRLGFAEREIEVAADSRVIDVWRTLTDEADLPRHVLTAVNFDYAAGDTPLNDGDEVAFFPPVTGGCGQ